MKKRLTIFFLFIVIFGYAQLPSKKENYSKISFLEGTITNYYNQPLLLYKCYGDTLLLLDSTITNIKGVFDIKISQVQKNKKINKGIYKIVLLNGQFFYIVYDQQPIKIKTIYQSDIFYNMATDSLKVLPSGKHSKEVNQQFYEFQYAQQQINVANYWLLKVMRVYPLEDPFHQEIEKEYFKRYDAIKKLVTISPAPTDKKYKDISSTLKVILAYHQTVNPDWKQPDNVRDSIIALHYFDYFKPADSFYLNTNILPEKIDIYIQMKINKIDKYGQPVNNEMFFAAAAKEFINHTDTLLKDETYQFCLNYILKKLSKEHFDQAFLSVYDAYLNNPGNDCGSHEKNEFAWARKKTDVLRDVQIGSKAPDFTIIKDKLNLYQITTKNTLLLFWASWCPHCVADIPQIKKIVDAYQQKNKKMAVVAVSLDTDKNAWQQFIQQYQLNNWINTSDFKKWNGSVPNLYNIYATPTMFLLDHEKNIISKPITVKELIKSLDTIL